MGFRLSGPDARPCVWMCAGLVSYRLCTRNYDCEHCPLDAALRGDLAAGAVDVAVPARERVNGGLPEDRLYSMGHLWVRALGEGRPVWRVGLDGFAASIIDGAASVRCRACDEVLERGEPIFELDLGAGVLRLGAPFGGRVVHVNEDLRESPAAVLTAPYDEGWVAELTGTDAVGLDELCSAETARQRADLDARRFRRSVAFRLLADSAGGPPRADARQRLTDLRHVLGAAGYVELLREFIH